MRVPLILAFALMVIGVAWLVSRGGPGASPAVELSRPGAERPLEEPGIDPVAGSEAGSQGRIAATEEGDRIESVDEPAAVDPSAWEMARRRLGPDDVMLIVRVRTPDGDSLQLLLTLDQLTYRGFVDLEVRLSHGPIEIGDVLPRELEEGASSPFIKTRQHYAEALDPEALAVLSFRPEVSTVFVSVLANRRVVAVRHVRCDIEEVDFVISVEEARSGHPSFHARFVDGAGSPVEGVVVGPCSELFPGRAGESGPDGRVEIGILEPGLYEYGATHEAYATAFLGFELEAGQALDLGTIVLVEPVTIAGCLIGPEAELRGREVTLRPLTVPAGSTAPPPDRQVISEQDGRFVFEKLEPGVYALRVASQVRVVPGRRQNRPLALFSSFVRVDATGGSVPDAAIQLEPGNWVTIRSRYAGDELVDLLVLDAAGLLLDQQVTHPGELETWWFLPSGRLRLEAMRAGRTEAFEFESAPGAELDVGP